MDTNTVNVQTDSCRPECNGRTALSTSDVRCTQSDVTELN